MMLAGASMDFKAEQNIGMLAEDYHYTKQGDVCSVEELNDSEEWVNMAEAMAAVGIEQSEQDSLLSVVAAVMLLGEVKFTGGDRSAVKTTSIVDDLAKVIGVPSEDLSDALTHNTIVAQSETVKSPLNEAQAAYARLEII